MLLLAKELTSVVENPKRWRKPFNYNPRWKVSHLFQFRFWRESSKIIFIVYIQVKSGSHTAESPIVLVRSRLLKPVSFSTFHFLRCRKMPNINNKQQKQNKEWGRYPVPLNRTSLVNKEFMVILLKYKREMRQYWPVH